MSEKIEIMEALERLETHCRAPLMAVDAKTGWLKDWCEDLAEFDIEDIRAACQKWRNGEDRKFPLPGQFKAVLRSLKSKVTTDCADHGGPWRPLSDAEYDQLTLRDKIRHHQILSQQCFRKAGPQWKSGRPMDFEEMPPEWHEWRARAHNHAQEATALKQKLSRFDPIPLAGPRS